MEDRTSLVVEYILIVDGSDSFCVDDAALVRLLELNSSLSIKNGLLHHGEFAGKLSTSCGTVHGNSQRYFHLKLESTRGIADADQDGYVVDFTALLKAVRSAVQRLNPTMCVLRDDIASYYCRKAYPIIEDIENTMRQLIGHFMILKVGREWFNESVPNAIKKPLSDNSVKRKSDDANPLQAADFIHLSQFLLRPYAFKSSDQLMEKLRKLTGTITLDDLADYIPKSNWDRYFVGLVACDGEYIEKRWSKLYELRCAVAHNAGLARSDFEALVTLVGELRPKLVDALGKLPQVQVPISEQQAVADNAASNASSAYGEYIAAWVQVEDRLTALLKSCGSSGRITARSLAGLKSETVISDEMYSRIIQFRDIRNRIAHYTTDRPSEQLAVEQTQDLRRLKAEIETIFIPSTQQEAIQNPTE
ncbi:MAG: hypothetical protein ACLQVD_09935 [Capsulimonadaceae bacterium]